MPAGRSNAITLSFAKKNQDVLNLLNEKKKDSAFVQNDYICEAIRFFEKNKNRTLDSVNTDEIKKIVDERFEQLKKQLLKNSEISIDINNQNVTFNDEILEENANDINPIFLGDD